VWICRLFGDFRGEGKGEGGHLVLWRERGV
jgi:hypothetical protein